MGGSKRSHTDAQQNTDHNNHIFCSYSFLFSGSEDVEFCGYTITHPSENKINFRIQTRGKEWLLNLYYVIFLVLCAWFGFAYSCKCQTVIEKNKKPIESFEMVEQHTHFFQRTVNAHTSLYVIRSTQKAEIPAKAPTPLRLNPRTRINLMGSSLAHCPAFNQGMSECSQEQQHPP